MENPCNRRLSGSNFGSVLRIEVRAEAEAVQVPGHHLAFSLGLLCSLRSPLAAGMIRAPRPVSDSCITAVSGSKPTTSRRRSGLRAGRVGREGGNAPAAFAHSTTPPPARSSRRSRRAASRSPASPETPRAAPGRWPRPRRRWRSTGHSRRSRAGRSPQRRRDR
jgi:hypothetical protein